MLVESTLKYNKGLFLSFTKINFAPQYNVLYVYIEKNNFMQKSNQ